MLPPRRNNVLWFKNLIEALLWAGLNPDLTLTPLVSIAKDVLKKRDDWIKFDFYIRYTLVVLKLFPLHKLGCNSNSLAANKLFGVSKNPNAYTADELDLLRNDQSLDSIFIDALEAWPESLRSEKLSVNFAAARLSEKFVQAELNRVVPDWKNWLWKLAALR